METFYNAKVEKFFSRLWNPGSAGVDFFIQCLELENCLVVPPVELIARVLHYLKVQRALATLVIPFWPWSSFWPLIANNVPMLLLCKVTFWKMVVALPWEEHKFHFGIEIFPWASCRHQVLFSFKRERKIG